MSSYISPIDSQRFGFQIAKVNSINDLVKPDFISSLKKEDVKMVISRIESENLEGIRYLENEGFRIMDIQSTYRFNLKKTKINQSFYNSELSIREATDRDIALLSKIARDSFQNYGHYFADKKLNSVKCSEIYSDWTKRSIIDSKVANRVLVASFGGTPAGFLSFKIHRQNNFLYASGGLGAVSKQFRGHNIFSTLAIEGLLWGKSKGFQWEEHNVLNTNYPVNRVFSKIGFSIVASYITLHYWL